MSARAHMVRGVPGYAGPWPYRAIISIRHRDKKSKDPEGMQIQNADFM